MVYDKRLGARISVCACEQCLFDLLRVDDVTCSPPYDRVSKRDDVRDVFVLVSINNLVCTKAPVDWAVNDIDSLFATETP